MNKLVPLVWLAGAIQLVIALANIFIPRILRYGENLARVDTIVRQVFVVHATYIVLVLVGLAGLCFGFAPELAGGSVLGRVLSAGIALFWTPRIVIQLFYYDAVWKRRYPVHHALFSLAFIYLAVVFWVAAITGGL